MEDQLQAWMGRVLDLADLALSAGEVPVGALVVDLVRGDVIAESENRMRRDNDPTSHAEMLVIRAACLSLGSSHLSGLSIFVNLEPCSMCASAISFSRLDRLVFGAYDVKSGGVEHGACIFSHSGTHHKPEVIGGVCESLCRERLSNFFAGLRV